MPRHPAPARFAAATTAAAVLRTGANLSSASICCPPGREPRGAVLREQGGHPEAGKAEIARVADADRPPACSMLPPRELASTGIGLDAMPLPRIEEISGRGTFTRPMP